MNDLFDYRQDLDALRFTPGQKARIAEEAVSAARKETRRTRRPLRKTALIAAAAVLILAVGTAGASGALKSAVDAFSGIFGGGAAQTEIIDQIGRPIGASDTSCGVTITADAIIGDKYNAVIVYTLSRDDGEPLLPAGVTVRQLVLGGFGGASWAGGGSHGSAWFTDEDPADNAIQYVESVSADEALTHGTARARFQDLSYWDEAAGESVLLAEGRWDLKFQVDYEDTSVRLGGGETFTQGGMTFTVDGVSVSPVAVRVDYTVDSRVHWSDAPSGRESEADSREMERYLENVEILLTKTDGTVMDLSGAGGSISPRDGVTVCSKSTVLEEIVPLEEMAAISVGGVAYPIR